MLNKNTKTRITTRSQQIALLPSVNTVFTQGPGYCKDGTKFNYLDWTYDDQYAYTHQKYRAMDLLTLEGKLLAPFDCTCVYFEYGGSSAKNAIFQSDQPVVCADGSTSYVAFMVTHGGRYVQTSQGTLTLNAKFKQGEWLYSEGTEGNVPKHIHINAIKREFTSFSTETEFVRQQGKMYNNQGELEAYDFSVLAFKNDVNLEDIFYLQEGETITFDSASTMWKPHVKFKTYTGATELNGWVDNGGTWYFYKDGAKVKGWMSEGGAWFYLDYTTGAMKTGWAADGKKWYYLNPDNGHMVTGWKWIDDAWYYLNPNDGGAMHTGWLYDGGNTYFMDGNGRMLKGGTFDIGGNKYTFDNSGCLVK